jgi:hypothetical protein
MCPCELSHRTKKRASKEYDPFSFLLLISFWLPTYHRTKLEKNVNEGDTYHTHTDQGLCINF